MKEINVGDFVTYLDDYYCVIDAIKEGAIVYSYKLQHLLTEEIINVRYSINSINEYEIVPTVGMKVIYNDTIWTVEDVDIPDALSRAMYQIKKNNDSTAVDRNDLKVFNPVTDAHLMETDKPNSNAFFYVITTGSFVVDSHSFTSYYVVMEIQETTYKLQNLSTGYSSITHKEDVEYITEDDIKLVEGIKVIYDGRVGTYFNSGKDANGKVVHYIKETGLSIGEFEYEIFNPYFHDYKEKNGEKILKMRDFIETRTVETAFGKVTFVGEDLFKKDSEHKGPALTSFDFVKINDEDGCNEDDATYEEDIFEYEAGGTEEITENKLLLNSFVKLQAYLDELDPKSKYSNEDFCKGLSETLTHNVAMKFINKIIVRKYGQKVVCKLIFNGYSTQISITIYKKEGSENYDVKVLVFDNFKSKESFTGPLAYAHEYLVNLIASKDLNKSLFDIPNDKDVKDKDLFDEEMDVELGLGSMKHGYKDEESTKAYYFKEVVEKECDPFEEELPFKPIDQEVGLKQSEGKLMVQELYWPFIEQMARVMTINKEKYPPKNYLKPMDKEELLAAAQRHTIAIWNGEKIDPTDGQLHSAKVATNMMMYYAQTILYA